MKLMIASDLHGSFAFAKRLTDAYAQEKADKLLLLGDLLYHGPRNDLPLDYAPQKVIALLNAIKDSLVCVRGNCDAEVDQMVLDFPILAEAEQFSSAGIMFHLVHGHHLEDRPVAAKEGDVVLFGHTHVPAVYEKDGAVYLNPGSTSIPKENSPHSYVIYENGLFSWKNLEDGSTYKTFSLE